MNCPKCVAVFLFVLACTALTDAQDKTCKLKLVDLPEIAELSGFRIGMTKDQVKSLVPQVKFGHTNEFGVSRTTINPDFDPRIDKTHFAHVRSVSLDFLDGTISSIWVGFDSSHQWKTAEEFIAGISRKLALPDQWQTKGRTQQLMCADFQLSVSMIAGGPSFRIIDNTAENSVAQRRQEKEDAAEGEQATSEPVLVIGDSSHKVFYPIDCPALKTVPEKNRVSFASPAEAEKAGYRPVEGCP